VNIPFIIAEIGINHNGSLEIAKKLIDMAFECGCNAVKFQKRTLDIVYTQEFLDSPRESPWGTTQRHQKEGLEFEKDEYDEIDRYCKELGIPWFASAWDLESYNFLKQYDLKYNKIASAMITFKPLVEAIAKDGKHTFISTGMTDFEHIDSVINLFRKNLTPFTLLHCVSVYPCPDELCGINTIKVLRDRYGCDVGYSGHELGILPSSLAVAFGAVVIERHVTLDRSMYGSDQSASLERRGLEYVVRDCRDVKKMLNGVGKKISKPEMDVAYKLRYFREA